MASAVNNLRVNGKEVKSIMFKTASMKQFVALKEFYYNKVLVWKNANPFIFIQNISKINLDDFGSDTLIFENFGNEFKGSYNNVESLEEKPKDVGQMVALKIELTEGEKK